LAWLRSEWGVRRLVCEGGGRLNASLIHADLVDEIYLTVCPWIAGGRESPTLADGAGVSNLADASTWRLVRHRRIADEMFLVYRRTHSRPRS
jgi:riboflavin biosynthesis pyrimidine reductase